MFAQPAPAFGLGLPLLHFRQSAWKMLTGAAKLELYES